VTQTPTDPMRPPGLVAGVGIDLVDLDELREIIERRGTSFLERVFTPREAKYCEAREHPIEHFGARFAAKEAALKALGTGWSDGISWTDVEVVVESSGSAPALSVTGEFAVRAARRGIDGSQVSLTHTRHHASAVVILTSSGR
jgi:holo-[acyl-carrier protein] synthase